MAANQKHDANYLKVPNDTGSRFISGKKFNKTHTFRGAS